KPAPARKHSRITRPRIDCSRKGPVAMHALLRSRSSIRSWGYEVAGAGEAIMRARFGRYFHLKRSIPRVAGIRWVAITLVVGMVVALAGCAGQVVEPEPRIVRVEVPVVVPCRTDEVAVPPWASEGLRK